MPLPTLSSRDKKCPWPHLHISTHSCCRRSVGGKCWIQRAWINREAGLVFFICILGVFMLFYYFCVNSLWVCTIAWRELLVPSFLLQLSSATGVHQRTKQRFEPQIILSKSDVASPNPGPQPRMDIWILGCPLCSSSRIAEKRLQQVVCANYVATTVLKSTPVTKTSF